MENFYYLIIISAIILEYLLSSIGSILDIRSITPEIPKDFQSLLDRLKTNENLT